MDGFAECFYDTAMVEPKAPAVSVVPKAPTVSVVVPVRNEADNIAPLAAEIVRALGGTAFELIFVNDGSTDTTAAMLRGLCDADPRVRAIHHRRSCGQSAAIVTGVRAARGDWLATLDGDGQNDPADLPALLERAAAGGPGCLAAGHRTRRRDSWIKRRTSRIANGVRARLLRDCTPDTGCGLKVMRRELFLALPHFDHMHRFLPALVLRAGGTVVSVPVNHRPRLRGRSNYGTLDRLAVGIVDLAGVWWLQRRWRIPEIGP